MKTVFINCSPKKRLSASGFIAGFTGVFVRGKKLSEKLYTKGDYSRVLEAVRGADNVVFSMPLYVDSVPSHVLPFLKEMENFCRENGSNFNVYVIANNGFIEGKQNEPLMQVMGNFCERSGNRWCGGLGIGGGVMMNVLRILITVFFALMLVNVLRGLLLEHSFKTEYLILFAKQALEVIVFGCGIITFDIWLATCINRRKEYGKHYTRIMLPALVFIIVADIFFVITSIFTGGIFRGWLSKKQPSK